MVAAYWLAAAGWDMILKARLHRAAPDFFLESALEAIVLGVILAIFGGRLARTGRMLFPALPLVVGGLRAVPLMLSVGHSSSPMVTVLGLLQYVVACILATSLWTIWLDMPQRRLSHEEEEEAPEFLNHPLIHAGMPKSQ
jgi:hypothetical protein